MLLSQPQYRRSVKRGVSNECLMISYNTIRKNKTLLQVLPSPVPAAVAADMEKKEKPKESSSASG